MYIKNDRSTWDSNPEPSAPKADALSIALANRIASWFKVTLI